MITNVLNSILIF